MRVQKTAICVTNARRRVRGRPNILAVDTCDLFHSEDAFEARMARFQQALSAQDDDSSPYDELDGKGGCILRTLRHLRKATWGGGTQRGKSDDDDDHDDDSLFTSLIDFREEIKAAEARMVSAHSAYESLASLTAPSSALVALENVRKLLLGISADDVGPLFDAIEKTHELLNDVESSLNDCARSIDGGLMSTLEKMAFTGIPLEVVDGIIADWNALARKHGISVSGSRHSGIFFMPWHVLSILSCSRILYPTVTCR